MPEARPSADASRHAILAALGAVYIAWGGTYLAIRYVVETIPPYLSAGARFIVAGAIMYAWLRAKGAAAPRPKHWAAAALIGGMLLLGGNGSVVWAEQFVASGLAALLVATVPLWMVLLDWLLFRGPRPGPAVIAGLALGFAGVTILVDPGGGSIHLFGALAILGAALIWATGSLLSSRVDVPDNAALATAMQMLAGGALLTLTATLRGEWSGFEIGAISAASWWGWVYLVVVGSLIGFAAYIWLLRAAPPATVATYAYVNPLVAVFVGWAIASEPITPRTLVAGVAIIGAVMLITRSRARAARGDIAAGEGDEPATAMDTA